MSDKPYAVTNARFVVPPLGGSSPGFRPKPVLRTSIASSLVRYQRSALVCLLLIAGCSSRDIDAEYGHRVGVAARSVNGTTVLADIFQRAGHNVSTWGSLSPRLHKRADCIVWFPDDFSPPNRKTVAWLEGWLAAQPDRTLVYVGRDFDAAPSYWNAVLADAPDEWKDEIRTRGASAQSRFLADRRQASNSPSCDWFTFRDTLRNSPSTIPGRECGMDRRGRSGSRDRTATAGSFPPVTPSRF